MVKTTVLDTWI